MQHPSRFPVVLLLAASLAAAGCSTEGLLGGTAGAAGGAGLGYLAGGPGGALIGAAAGGLAGTAIGESVHQHEYHSRHYHHGCHPLRFCPAGGEEYPAEYQICPVHRTELAWRYR